jgi:hypothetical protein
VKALNLLVAASVCASCAPGPAVNPELLRVSTEIVERYGPAEFGIMHSPSGDWLVVTMRDRRFRKSHSAALDSTKAIAEYTASLLPADFRPDSIKVRVLVKSLNLGIFKTSETISQTYAMTDLQ